MNLNQIICSAAVAAIASGIFVLTNVDRKIHAEGITQERVKWRAKIRDLSIKIAELIISSKFNEIQIYRIELETYLNPLDSKDRKIISILEAISLENSNDVLKEFITRITLLLKHDWECSKRESSVLKFFHRSARHEFPIISALAQNDSPKSNLNRIIILSSIKMAGALGVAFYISTKMKDICIFIIQHLSGKDSSIANWASFLLLAALVGIVWTPFYLIFKYSEKAAIEALCLKFKQKK